MREKVQFSSAVNEKTEIYTGILTGSKACEHLTFLVNKSAVPFVQIHNKIHSLKTLELEDKIWPCSETGDLKIKYTL